MGKHFLAKVVAKCHVLIKTVFYLSYCISDRCNKYNTSVQKQYQIYLQINKSAKKHLAVIVILHITMGIKHKTTPKCNKYKKEQANKQTKQGPCNLATVIKP